MAKFIVVKHEAKRAGLHYDLRFEMPNSNLWASFAVPKGVPTEPGKKVLAVRTHDHTKEEALYLGTIRQGYGAGKLSKWDSGNCTVKKFEDRHIVVDFKGSKVKGLYHFVKSPYGGKVKQKQYFLFKGKIA
jgi:bifunctional non-homologous end joining protein LigD